MIEGEADRLPTVIARSVSDEAIQKKSGLLRTYLAMTKEWIPSGIPRNDDEDRFSDALMMKSRFGLYLVMTKDSSLFAVPANDRRIIARFAA
ncbi:MAG: hypothetical protein A2103_00335 [Gammaproteobacteria bacterium GWF2_41_13]|nr:MAG: hypothetical protein A2103_00335 [Gammaproteobacteria bacterium GWF2_41_13]